MNDEPQVLSNDSAFDQWAVEFASVSINYRHSIWAIGDKLLEGCDRFDDGRVWRVAETTGLTHGTLENYRSMAKAYPPQTRRLNLSFGIHEAARPLPPVR